MATGINYQGRDGELRLIDKSQSGAGAAGTPFGHVVRFEQMDFQMQMQMRPEDLVRLDRQRISDDAHLQVGSEENMYAPVDISFSMVLSSRETDALMQFAGVDWAQKATANPNDANTALAWTVKGTPATGLVSTKARGLSGDGLYAGGRIDSRGSIIALQGFADVKKVAVDVEVIWQERAGANKFGYRLKEVNFEPGKQQISESADYVTIRMTGSMYGEATRITSFSRAMSVLTSTLL